MARFGCDCFVSLWKIIIIKYLLTCLVSQNKVYANEGSDDNEGAVIYDLNGIRQNQLQKGLNIVNGKKVYVK